MISVKRILCIIHFLYLKPTFGGKMHIVHGYKYGQLESQKLHFPKSDYNGVKN